MQTDPDEMTDAEEAMFNERVEDPAKIASAEEAVVIIEYLDDDIGDIRMQLDAAKIERDVVGDLSAERRAWAAKAAYALASKIRQRAAVGARLGELRPTVVVPVEPAPQRGVSAEILLLQIEQQRLAIQRDAEKQAAKARNAEVERRRASTKAEMFVSAARDIQSADDNQAVWDRAREMFPDSPAWTGVAWRAAAAA